MNAREYTVSLIIQFTDAEADEEEREREFDIDCKSW
jgi:hypothetical protein